MDDQERETVVEYVRQTRDEKRPPMDLVVEVFDRIFEEATGIVQHERGPVTWTWKDEQGSQYGFEKWYVLTQSAMAGCEGYPIVTIRQSIAPRLDSWLTFSQLVIGPDAREIESSLAMALGNHLGGFEGVREQVAAMIQQMGGLPTNPLSIALGKEDDGGGMN